jgi:hypothetical protein
MHKLAAALTVAALSLGATAAVASPAEARDTSWGCGGHC